LQVRGSPGRHTDPGPAIAYLKARGVKLAVDNPVIIKMMSKFVGYLVLNSYESPLLTPKVHSDTGASLRSPMTRPGQSWSNLA
jgi:hypothetical protein